MKPCLKKNWFFAAIVLVVLMAFGLPGLGRWMRDYGVLNIVISLAFLVTGMTLETSSIGRQLRQLRGPLVAMVSSFVLIPLLAWVLSSVALPREFVIGVCIMAAAPVTVASGTVMTDLGRGNVPLSLFICVLGNFIGVFTIPLSLNLLLRFEGQMSLPVWSMLGGLALTILLPTVLGQLIRPLGKERIVKHRRGLSIFQQCTVLMIIFNAVASSTSRILEAGSAVLSVLLFVVILHSLVLAMNYFIARLIRLDRPSTTAFTIHTSQKTLTISYVVWAGYFAAQFPMALIPGIGYHLTQMVMDSIVAQRFRDAAESAGAQPTRQRLSASENNAPLREGAMRQGRTGKMQRSG